ncbi:MAG: TetR/AcrR family transcriptional regulator [Gammaproteobacteria bacterium]|nr:TetR/AcrR family transcriptional regulator [Gammaproteobacteria bacterium]
MSEQALRSPSSSLEKLRQGARKLFVEQGYHNTRPQDIARESGVASGTFYIHFADKKEAFLDFAEQAQADLLREYTINLDGVSGHRNRWRVICNTVVEFSIQNPGVLQAAFLDPVFIAPNDENAWRLYDRLGRFVEMAMDHSDSDSKMLVDYDTELISHALCGMLRHAMVYASRKKMDRDKMIDDLSLFIDRGLGGR